MMTFSIFGAVTGILAERQKNRRQKKSREKVLTSKMAWSTFGGHHGLQIFDRP